VIHAFKVYLNKHETDQQLLNTRLVYCLCHIARYKLETKHSFKLMDILQTNLDTVHPFLIEKLLTNNVEYSDLDL
jgi:hypothetical protein